MGGNGMVREVDRAIGAISTLVVGIGLFMIREYLRNDKQESQQLENIYGYEEGSDLYFKKKYTAPKMPLFQHSGSCNCGALRFLILAPKRVEAFDDSNAMSCKKGRFPYLMLPTWCFDMINSNTISVYEQESTSCQHIFCNRCGIHIFHFDQATPEYLAVNLYSIEEQSFEDIKIIFVPKGARPLLGTPERLPLAVHQSFLAASRAVKLQLQHGSNLPRKEDSGNDPNELFQKQLLLWANLDPSISTPTVVSPHPFSAPTDKYTRKRYSRTKKAREYSFITEDPVDMKDQLEFYLKHHMETTKRDTMSDETHDV